MPQRIRPLAIGILAVVLMNTHGLTAQAAEAPRAPSDPAKRKAVNKNAVDGRSPAKAAKKKPKMKPGPFRWVNPLPARHHPRLHHATYFSKIHNTQVGYCIYLPSAYHAKAKTDQRFPVVYYLHGGRPGSELKSTKLVNVIDKHMEARRVQPAIYVFVNGGALSHYDHEKLKSFGESTFVKELIPHIDKTYRTVASRAGRGLEGFSQGGRGTARIMFKHPSLFVSAAPMGGGHQHERRIRDEDGVENPSLTIVPKWNNSWDLAERYAKLPKESRLNILVAVGTEDFNYQANLDWMRHLEANKITFEKIIVKGAPHSAMKVYEASGLQAMRFHAKHFASQ